MTKMDQTRDIKQYLEEKTVSANQDKYTNGVLEKLKQRAEQVGYGSLICEIQVHQGKIRQVDITMVKERMRAD